MSSRLWPIVIAGAVVAGTVAAVMLAVRRQPTQEAPAQSVARAPAPKQSQQPAIALKGGHMERRDPSGKLLWRVAADGEIEFDQANEVARGRDVKFEMVHEGKTPVIVKAPVFEANYKAQKLTFSEGVAGTLTDGSGSFRVNRLEYEFSTRKLIGTGGSKYIQGRYQATADTIVIDFPNKKARLRGNVKFTRTG